MISDKAIESLTELKRRPFTKQTSRLVANRHVQGHKKGEALTLRLQGKDSKPKRHLQISNQKTGLFQAASAHLSACSNHDLPYLKYFDMQRKCKQQ